MGHSYTCSRPEIFIRKPVVWEDRDTLVSVLMDFSSKAVFSPDEVFDSEDGLTIENIFGGLAGATIYIHPYYLAETLSEHMEEGEAWVYIFVQGEDYNSWSSTWRIVPGKVDEFDGKSSFEGVQKGLEPAGDPAREDDKCACEIRCLSGPCTGLVYCIEAGAADEYGEEIVIGRDPAESQIVIEDSEVSRKHAQIRFNGVFLEIRDLGSTNGTFLLEEGSGEGEEKVTRVGRDYVRLNCFGPEKILLGKGPGKIGFEVFY